MTEKTEMLTQVMEHIEALETVISMNNLIAGGLVTDPQIIRETAAASSAFIMMQVVGTRLLLDPETTQDMQNVMTQLAED